MNEETKEKLNDELEEAPEEGGSIIGVDEDIPFQEAKHRAETSRRLAYLLVGIMAVSFLMHYIAIAFLEFYGKSSATKTLSDAFSTWLPVISGLVGAAVTYFFTRERT